jgi:RNA polymerase sigma factor (sigma-70 family)
MHENLPAYYTKRIVMSREKERELLVAAKAGDQKARDTLVLAHLSYVVFLARCLKHVDLDTINMGVQGLIEAVDKFDLARENRFSTFARYQILMRLIMGIRIKMKLSGMSNALRKKCIESKITQDVDLPEEIFYNLLPSNPSVEKDIMKNQEIGIIQEAISTLKDREKDIITKHVMEESCTLEDLGNKYEISRERIRQIEVDVLNKLRIKLKRLKRIKEK